MFNKPRGKWEQIDLSTHSHPKWMTRAFKNNMFMVMVNDNANTTHGKAIRALVQKHDDSKILNHWQEMQRIKNEIFGEETTAVEFYPAKSKLIDDHNIYWMWIFPRGIIPEMID